jgi:menaquinone-dependent protoporphyrinogen oxidase
MTNTRTVLVAAASRHGATAEIAERIGSELRARLSSSDWDVRVEDADAIDTIEGYGAVVLGSAIYLGRWLKSARHLLENAGKPAPLGMWLFSSGPVAADAAGSESADTNEDVAARLCVKDNIVFPGRLDIDRLGRVERAVTSAMRIAGGDFRDWTAIDSWAGAIARELGAEDHTDDKRGAVRRT